MQYGTASYRVASTRLKTRPNRPTMHPYPMFSLDRSFIVVVTVLNFVIIVDHWISQVLANALPTDGSTDQPMDQLTDIACYRDASAHLKIKMIFTLFYRWCLRLGAKIVTQSHITIFQLYQDGCHNVSLVCVCVHVHVYVRVSAWVNLPACLCVCLLVCVCEHVYSERVYALLNKYQTDGQTVRQSRAKMDRKKQTISDEQRQTCNYQNGLLVSDFNFIGRRFA